MERRRRAGEQRLELFAPFVLRRIDYRSALYGEQIEGDE
jgi:hypothetical protein